VKGKLHIGNARLALDSFGGGSKANQDAHSGHVDWRTTGRPTIVISVTN
jgi:hypothetical protein